MDSERKADSLQDIIAALSQGSKEAFDSLYGRFVGKVHNFILRVSGEADLSKDITQEVFIRLWLKREGMDPTRSIESWLYVCARNLFLNELRSRRQGDAFAEGLKRTDLLQDNGTLDLVNYRSAERTIAGIVREMPPQRQKVFVLSRLYGLPAAEIARQMGISERTVENQLYQARKQISSMLNNNS